MRLGWVPPFQGVSLALCAGSSPGSSGQKDVVVGYSRPALGGSSECERSFFHSDIGACDFGAPRRLGLQLLVLRKIRPEMAVLRPETRPDGPGRSGNSVFRPDPAKLTLPGPVRPTFGHFRGRPTTPSGCKSVALTTRLRPDGPDGLPGTVAGPLAGPLAGWLPWLAGWVAPA